MSFEEEYKKKLVSAEKAAEAVNSGCWVDYGWTTGTPVKVDEAIAKRLPGLHDVNFRGGILMWEPEIFKIEEPEKHMTWNSWHMGGFERKAATRGFGFYCPLRYSELPRHYMKARPPWMWRYSRWHPWTATDSLISVPTAATWKRYARRQRP